jgi:hypothetical protein
MRAKYAKCMKDNGVDIVAAKQEAAAKPGSGAVDEKFAAANAICEPLYVPLPPWEKDPANPEARDFARDVLKCLKDKGVEHVQIAEDGITMSFGGTNNDARSISEGLRLTPDCEREVAARNK